MDTRMIDNEKRETPSEMPAENSSEAPVENPAEASEEESSAGNDKKSARAEKKEEKEAKKALKEANAEKEKLAASLAECEDRYKRMLAEYDNFRRRAAKEKEGIYADAYADALAAVLPVIDNLERAVSYAGDDENDQFAQGVRMTLKQFGDALARLGVEEIPALGQTFDPKFHNAVMHEEDESKGENEVSAVLQKGYKKGDRILRCAMVKVVN